MRGNTLAPDWPAPSAVLARALLCWHRAAGPFWLYVCAVPLLGVITPARRPPPRAAIRTSMLDQIAGLLEQPTAFFLDIPMHVSLPLAPHLNALGLYVLPIVQRWPEERARLSARPLVSLLVRTAREVVPPSEPRGAAFLLDGERSGRHLHARAGAGFDNRYHYSADRFPPADFLASRGLTRVCWLADGGVAKDVQPYVRGVREAGLEVHEIEVA